jgi:hypothetical protein
MKGGNADAAILTTQLAQLDQLLGQPYQYNSTTFAMLNSVVNQNTNFGDEL